MSVAPTLLGTTLEHRYRLDGVIAQGGMSTVYFGMDTRLDRPVAVKVMDHRYRADQQFHERFTREARAVARLNAPGIVAVYDQGEDLNQSFMVMELVNGGTLRELLRERGPMPPHAAYAVLQPVLAALGTAHAAGLVHRDIKPENILISRTGDVKLADFGLVRAVASAQVTSSGVILGTAAYVAPEQVQTGRADARSDVYSMGLMCYELLTGTTPFDGDTPLSLAYQRLDNDVPPPSHTIEGVPEEFDEFVVRATHRDPASRYVDANAMLDELQEIAEDLQLPRYRVPAPHNALATTAIARGPQVAVVAAVAGVAAAPSQSPYQATRQVTTPPVAHEPLDPPDLSTGLIRARDTFYFDQERARRRTMIWLAIILIVAGLLGTAGWLIGSGLMFAGL